jgi:MSHA pilin protein MshC
VPIQCHNNCTDMFPDAERQVVVIHRALRLAPRGFTLVELIVVMVLIGILAAYAAPSFLANADIQARGFRDETVSLMRYAQKTAIAQRRVVCVALNATGITLTIDTTPTPDGVCDAAPSLPSTPKGGVGLSSSLVAFKYTALGSTDQAANFTISISKAANIVVEAQTGYVHD